MRQVLDTKVGYTDEQRNAKKRAFEKVKAQAIFSGSYAMRCTLKELRRMLELEVITRKEYDKWIVRRTDTPTVCSPAHSSGSQLLSPAGTNT